MECEFWKRGRGGRKDDCDTDSSDTEKEIEWDISDSFKDNEDHECDMSTTFTESQFRSSNHQGTCLPVTKILAKIRKIVSSDDLLPLRKPNGLTPSNCLMADKSQLKKSLSPILQTNQEEIENTDLMEGCTGMAGVGDKGCSGKMVA